LGSGYLMVYGAGSITENLIITTENLYKKVKCLIDAYCDDDAKFGLPVIRTEHINNFPDINTVLVTVPHAFEQIKSNLKNIRNDINVLSISDLLE